MIKRGKNQTTMDYKKYIQMIDEYLQEQNNINREWVECLTVCRICLERMRPKKPNIKMTNYDRIKQMSIDDMSKLLWQCGNCENCAARKRCDRLPLDVVATVPCRSLTLQWLESEVEE